MRPCEADWIRDSLLALGPDKASPLLNLGSSTRHFREVSKPHIEARLLAPLRAAGFRIVHADMKQDDGVDLVGDVLDPAYIAQLQAMGFRSIICSNLLEHVRDPQAVARACEAIVGEAGHIVVTVPHSYPYHPDPIDTLYRPDPVALARDFPNSQIVASTILADGGLIAEEAGKGAANLIAYPVRAGWRIVSGLWRPRIALAQLHRLTWLVRSFKVSCATLVVRAAN
ncbi:methyltransferase domain-containing protein [Sphingomonas baiyangensis]|uniref:Methyltransferase domain-containing protein n=1 Tax=Sphingomonas baiyangensis TaxID=2572576 RepID=A0A4U1L532_9SPHN|nr:hypothetical protein [Sphingomonas baiyangensis]TKD51393.1 hypothetical protein FBR43_11985 [Sphingomonas baiyangensis]